MRNDQGRRDEWGEVGNELDNISPIYQLIPFCAYFIGSMRVACTHRKEIDELKQRRESSQVKINYNH